MFAGNCAKNESIEKRTSKTIKTMAQKCEKVPCPVCTKDFEAKEITDHVNKCLFLQEQSENREAKRTFSIFNQKSPGDPKAKRAKPSSSSATDVVDLCEVRFQ